MTKIEDESTVRFVPRKQDRDYLVISGETSGCWSTLGRNRGLNRMNISPSECMLEGAIVHQLLHVLGFGHVTNQQDRDFYLDVNWDHVRPEHVKSLNLHEGRIVPNYGMPFDVESIMHFGPNRFSHNGLDTIVPKVGLCFIGRSLVESFSFLHHNLFFFIHLIEPNMFVF